MAFESSIVEGEISTRTMFVRVENYLWSAPFETDYRIPDHALFRTLAPTPSRSQVMPASRRGWSADFEGLGFWPASVPLRFRSARPSLRIVYCRFPPRQLEALTDFGTAWGVDDNLKDCFGLDNHRLDQTVLRLAEETLEPGFGAALVVEGAGLMLAAELARHVRRLRADAEFRNGGLSPRQLKRIFECIGDADSGCPTIAELAQLCDLSERHLMRAFKQTTGLTIGAYVERTRTAKARELLQGSLPIKAIAARLGFSSPSHFSTAFRKATGAAPTLYRRRLQP
jgi:AraC family transcriptional regulator